MPPALAAAAILLLLRCRFAVFVAVVAAVLLRHVAMVITAISL